MTSAGQTPGEGRPAFDLAEACLSSVHAGGQAVVGICRHMSNTPIAPSEDKSINQSDQLSET